MRSRAVAVAAFALLVTVFAVDVLTPQTLVVAILLDVPIVLAALTQSRRLTAALVTTALLGDVTAAFLNAARDGSHSDAIVVGDRLLSMLSIVLVGFLSTAVQERAQRVGRLSAQEARARREATLSAAADRMRASLSPDLVKRAIVREAPRALDAEAAAWYPATAEGEILSARAGGGEVEVVDERPSPEIASLIHRVAEDGAVAAVLAVDPVGRFVLDRLRARSAIAIPLEDRGTKFAVLIATSASETPGETAVQTARAFAAVAVNALAQARLFGALAERNDALLQRQDVIRDLVYALSHDLRTPLAALSVTLRQAADGAYGPLPDRYAAVIRDSRVSIDDLSRLAETLLLVARFESGERQALRELIDLAAVVESVVTELGPTAEARGITLHAPDAVSAQVRAPRADLKRALTNLVANALQHTPSGGTVQAAIAAGRRTVSVIVSDDGYGVDERARPALFQRFSSASRPGGGTGLGLYIARRIVEESDGTIRYEPREPRGSTFTIELPTALA
ncbi:MAG TPA: ATP-binding protein [Candidatus Elarobacter sp.]